MVCISNKKITCSTCKYGRSSCVHVNYLLQNIHSYPSLSVFRDVLQMPPVAPITSTQSRTSKRIPFHPSSQQQVVMKQQYSLRYNITEGIAKLIPEAVNPCPICGCCAFKVVHVRDATIVSSTHLHLAKGRMTIDACTNGVSVMV